MTYVLITDDMAQAAFDWTRDNIAAASRAKAKRRMAEDAVKEALASAFLGAVGTVAEREAIARLSPEVKDANEEHYRWIQQDEWFKKKENESAALIDGWRTGQSNLRSLGKVG
jgi:hypothetical protein